MLITWNCESLADRTCHFYYGDNVSNEKGVIAWKWQSNMPKVSRAELEPQGACWALSSIFIVRTHLQIVQSICDRMSECVESIRLRYFHYTDLFYIICSVKPESHGFRIIMNASLIFHIN